MNLILKSWRMFLDVLFPPVCISCRRYFENPSEAICKNCFENIKFNRIFSEPSPKFILGAAARYDDASVRELIHALKYESLPAAAKPLAELIIKHIEFSHLRQILEPEKSIIIPLPLHPKRLRTRGYNQSELIANHIGKYLNIPVRADILRRVKNTEAQIKMKNHAKRDQNIKGAFEINSGGYSLSAKHFILVDDVYTSGATVNEAVKTIKELKPKKIIGLVAAHAGYR